MVALEKSQRITKVIMIYPLGTNNVSVWNFLAVHLVVVEIFKSGLKEVDWLTRRHCYPSSYAACVAKKVASWLKMHVQMLGFGTN